MRLEDFSPVVLDLGLVSQGVVDTAAQHPVGELAGLLPDDVAIVADGGRLREFHVLDDESAAVACDGANFLAFLHAKERTHDVGLDTEVTQHTRIEGNIGNRRRLGAKLVDHPVDISATSLHLLDGDLALLLVEDLVLGLLNHGFQRSVAFVNHTRQGGHDKHIVEFENLLRNIAFLGLLVESPANDFTRIVNTGNLIGRLVHTRHRALGQALIFDGFVELVVGPVFGDELVGISINLLIGLGANICTSVVLFAGRLVDVEMGLGMANIMDPTSRENATITGVYYRYMVMLIMIISGMYQYLISALAETFTLIPVGDVVINYDKILDSFIVFMG